MELKGKRLLILGGSRISCEIIKHARDLGIVTGVTDWYPMEKSPAKQLADEAYFENTSNIDAMTHLFREKNFDGVFTGFTDSVLPYYAEFCDKVGCFCYGTKEQFEIFTDKSRYKQLMADYDIPTIPEYHIETERFEETTDDIAFPVLIKPVDGSGSRGITICNDKEALRKAVSFAEDNSKAKRYLIEKYIDGPEVTVFWLFVDSKYYVTLIGNRHIKHNKESELALPVGYTYPASVQPRFLSETAPKMEKMFRSIGIKNGVMFMQCKVIDDVCIVYDVGYRMTGTLEYINLKGMCGFDPMDMMIRFALTGKMDASNCSAMIDPYLGGRYSYNVSLLCKPGNVAEIRGIDDVRALPGVFDVVVAHPPGDVITQAMKGRLAQISIRVLGGADDICSMKTDMLKIHKLVQVISDEGEEMLLPGMEESDYEGTLYE